MEGVFEMKINWKSKILACVTSLMVIFGAPFCAALTSEEARHILDMYFCNAPCRSVDSVTKKVSPNERLCLLQLGASYIAAQSNVIRGRFSESDLCSLISEHPELVDACFRGESLLHHATRHGLSSFVDCLIANNARLDKVNSDGNTPLMIAILHDFDDIVESLLNGGADPNHVNKKNGFTPLLFALRSEKLTGFEKLLSHGADVNLRHDIEGTLPLEYALYRKKYPENSDVVITLKKYGAHESGDGDSCCCAIM